MVPEKKRLTDVVGSLDYEELVNLQRDLFKGGGAIKQVITNRIREMNTAEARTCGTCGTAINLRTAKEFTLIFGPADLKKRASFCALDCMDYFFNNLKQRASKNLQKAQQA
jgi:hypothetical protein